MSAFPKAGCHAVLALLSERYPPLEGRSPTCYSPVCHSTYPLRGFRVRLACVRHAASVDSEPGSNSHVKSVAPRPPAPPCGRSGLARRELPTQKPFGSCCCSELRLVSCLPLRVAWLFRAALTHRRDLADSRRAVLARSI